MKFTNLDVRNDASVIFDVSNVSLPACLSRCASRFDCAAVAYNPERSSCRLLSLSVHTVYDFDKYFKFSSNFDVYERNCQIKSMKEDFSNCTVMKLNQVGYTDMFDVRLDAVADLSTCETICLSWKQGLCRSFTFDKREKRCFISHSTPKLFGWQPMMHLNDDLTFGEIDNCFKFDLFCGSDTLTLYGNSLRIFEGGLKSKNNAAVFCEKNVTATHDFSFSLKYGECGIEKEPTHSYAGTILIKEGSTDMVTIRDRMIRISCKMDNGKKPIGTQSLSFSLELTDNNSTIS
uniref:Uncharacterized protein n=1 Tax=Panagrolaimus sp. JU765 TaxID=591449 RepID=A0AC34Q2J7_9BILA